MLSFLKYRMEKFLFPLTGVAVRFGLRPNHITLFGFLIGLIAASLIALSRINEGIIVLILSAFMDVFDGAMARNEDITSDFGGFFDSVVDRYVDIAIFVSLGYYTSYWLLAIFALSGAMLVSYTRARAEKIIPKCDVGIAERGERIVLVILGLLTGYIWEILVLIAILAHVTAIHRVLYTYKKAGLG